MKKSCRDRPSPPGGVLSSIGALPSTPGSRGSGAQATQDATGLSGVISPANGPAARNALKSSSVVFLLQSTKTLTSPGSSRSILTPSSQETEPVQAPENLRKAEA